MLVHLQPFFVMAFSQLSVVPASPNRETGVFPSIIVVEI